MSAETQKVIAALCIRTPSLVTKGILVLTDEQLKILFSIPDMSTFTGFRYYVIMIIMFDNGIRIKELLSLRFDHISYSSKEILLSGSYAKNRKFRRLSFDSHTVDMIKKLERITKLYWPENNYVFVSTQGNMLDASTVRRILREYGELAGIQGSCSPHMFAIRLQDFTFLETGIPYSCNKSLDTQPWK